MRLQAWRPGTRPWVSVRDFPEGGAIKVEKFADAALGAIKFVVYLVSGEVDKARGYFSQKRREP